MGRLIDADILLGAMDEKYKEKKDIVPDNLAEGFFQMEKLIKEQPTVYDVEKVVAELEKQKSNLTDWAEDKAFEIGIEKSIDIVRKGGIDG